MTLKSLEMHSISFLKKMFKANGGVSSKRVVGFSSFILVMVSWIVAFFGGPLLPEYYYFGVIGIILGCFGLNSAVSATYLKTHKNNSDTKTVNTSNDLEDRG
jgi:hypothetical protein